jgi:hypothetical protein
MIYRACQSGKSGGVHDTGTGKKGDRDDGNASKIKFKPLPPDTPCRGKPDIGLAKPALNWPPHIALEEGLKKTIELFKNFSFCKPCMTVMHGLANNR